VHFVDSVLNGSVAIYSDASNLKYWSGQRSLLPNQVDQVAATSLVRAYSYELRVKAQVDNDPAYVNQNVSSVAPLTLIVR